MRREGMDARSRPAKAGIQWFRPSIPACKQAGMTTQYVGWRELEQAGVSPIIPPAPFLDSGLRRNDAEGETDFLTGP